MSKNWQNIKKVLERKKRTRNLWSAGIRVPIGVPMVLDKLKENCGRIAEWWLGAGFQRDDVESCREVDGVLNYDCVLNKFQILATASNIKPLGAGQYGATYLACKLGNCNYVLKIQKADESFRREVFALYELNGWDYSPLIFDAWTCGEVGFFVIEKLQSLETCSRMSKQEISDQIETMIRELHERDFFHLDIKPDNMMCKNGHLALIDFGMAVKIPTSEKFRYVLGGKHPTVANPKKPWLRENLLEFEDETMQDTIDNIYRRSSA